MGLLRARPECLEVLAGYFEQQPLEQHPNHWNMNSFGALSRAKWNLYTKDARGVSDSILINHLINRSNVW